MELLRVPSRKAALAFGLKWVLVDSFEPRHQQIRRWKADGYTQHASYRLDGDTVFGLVRDASPQDQVQVKGLNVVAAGACVASLSQLKGKTALVIIELPSHPGDAGGVAVVGLDKGIVVVDTLCDTHSQVSETRQSFAQRVKGEFEVHGSGAAAGQVQQELRLEDLVQKPKAFGASNARIEALRSDRGYWLAGAVAIVLLLSAGGLAAWDSHHAEIKRRTQLATLDANKPENLYRQSIQALMLRDFVPLHSAIQVMRQDLGDFPLVHAGWELQRIACPVSGDCAVRFKRMVGSGASLDEFRRTAPPTWLGVASASQDEIAFVVRLEFPTSKLRRESWARADAFRDRNFASWQALEPIGWRAEMSQLAIQALPAKAEPKDLVALHNHPEAVFAMTVAINQQPWWFAGADRDSPVRLDLLGDHTVLDGEIELLHLNKAIVFSAKGLSYVQK